MPDLPFGAPVRALARLALPYCLWTLKRRPKLQFPRLWPSLRLPPESFGATEFEFNAMLHRVAGLVRGSQMDSASSQYGCLIHCVSQLAWTQAQEEVRARPGGSLEALERARLLKSYLEEKVKQY